MKLFKRLLIGYTYILLEEYSPIFFVNGHNCAVKYEERFLSVDCSDLDLQEVPQDLPLNTEILILYNTTLKNINSNSFEKYPNLIALVLSLTAYLDEANPIDYNTFRGLQKLEILDLSESRTRFKFFFYLPASLTLLGLDSNDFITDLGDLTNLTLLRGIHLQKMNLRFFPQLSKLTPLTEIDLRHNPMDAFAAEDLAPYCLLEYIALEWPEDNAVLTHPDRYCQCARLEYWLSKYLVNTTTREQQTSLNCTPPEDIQERDCNFKFTDRVLQTYRDCLARQIKPKLVSWILIFCVAVITAVLVLITYVYRVQGAPSKIVSYVPRNSPGLGTRLEVDMSEENEEEENPDIDNDQEHARENLQESENQDEAEESETSYPAQLSELRQNEPLSLDSQTYEEPFQEPDTELEFPTEQADESIYQSQPESDSSELIEPTPMPPVMQPQTYQTPSHLNQQQPQPFETPQPSGGALPPQPMQMQPQQIGIQPQQLQIQPIPQFPASPAQVLPQPTPIQPLPPDWNTPPTWPTPPVWPPSPGWHSNPGWPNHPPPSPIFPRNQNTPIENTRTPPHELRTKYPAQWAEYSEFRDEPVRADNFDPNEDPTFLPEPNEDEEDDPNADFKRRSRIKLRARRTDHVP